MSASFELAGLRLVRCALVGIAFSLIAAVPSYAQSEFSAFSAETQSKAGTVRSIRVEGTQRIEPETVLSYIIIKPGDPHDASTMDLSLKRLFRTGLFADVVIRRFGDDIVVRVVENPIINRVAFEGNKALDDDKIGEEVEITPRTVFTRARVQGDVTRVIELYRRSGRFAAKVTPKVVQLPQNRVDLIFEIVEGPVTGIGKINFVGNVGVHGPAIAQRGGHAPNVDLEHFQSQRQLRPRPCRLRPRASASALH